MADTKGYKLHGNLGESARLEQVQLEMKAQGLQGGAINLNEVPGCMNLPVVDLGTSEGFESCKACNSVKQAVSHMRELQIPYEEASSSVRSSRSTAAMKIVKHAQEIQRKGGWSKNLKRDAGEDEVQQELQERTNLAVPDDVIDAKDEKGNSALMVELTKKVTLDPRNWNVKTTVGDITDAVKERVNQLMPRFVRMGKTRGELSAEAESSEGQAESATEVASNLERLAMPQPEPASAPGRAFEPANASNERVVEPTSPPSASCPERASSGPAGAEQPAAPTLPPAPPQSSSPAPAVLPALGASTPPPANGLGPPGFPAGGGAQ